MEASGRIQYARGGLLVILVMAVLMAGCTPAGLGTPPLVVITLPPVQETIAPTPVPDTPRSTSTPTATPAPIPPTVTPAPTSTPRVQRPPIISRADWGALPPNGDYTLQTPVALILHHEGIYFDGTTREEAMAYIRKVQNYCMSLPPEEDPAGVPWVDIAYHFVIDPQGHIYEGRPVDKRPNSHTYDCTGHIAIAVLGDYNVQAPNPEQIQAVVDLMAWLAREYEIPLSEIYGHRDFGGTSCPGDNLYSQLDAIRAAVRQKLGD